MKKQRSNLLRRKGLKKIAQECGEAFGKALGAVVQIFTGLFNVVDSKDFTTGANIKDI